MKAEHRQIQQLYNPDVEYMCEHFPNMLTPLDQQETGNEIIRTHRCDGCGSIIKESFKLIDTYVS